MKKYSKSSNFYRNIKSSFYNRNESLLKAELDRNRVYLKQPPRDKCKLCGSKLPETIDFTKHLVSYKFCRKCDHLNGIHDDTLNFAKEIYSNEDGSDYSKLYLEDNYNDRINHIYLPKADFLIDQLSEKISSVYDFGCGLGFLVNSFLSRGIDAKGGDVNKTLINAGNGIIENNFDIRPLESIDIERVPSHIKSLDVEVLSLMAVVEHISNLDEFLEAINLSSFKYLYYSVPIYGLSVPIESVFENVLPRHLSGGHTHLFTEKSLEILNKKLGVKPIAEWRFGTDIQDLKRSIQISLQKTGSSDYFIQRFENEFSEYADQLQEIIDKNHNCSQIHVICKKL